MNARTSLVTRLFISTLVVVFIACALIGGAAWLIASTWIRNDTAQEATRQATAAIGRIATIDQLSRAQVDMGMRVLEDQGRQAGAPSVSGTVSVAGRTLPNLRLGSQAQAMNFALVDRVKSLAGGTATLFVFDGSDFVRVTTNVMKPDGSRAVGTVLDRQGKAYAALSQGRGFQGVVNILGVPYTTSYEPMMDANGKLVGAWYTGYRLDSIGPLGKSIEEMRIMDHGFMALLNAQGVAVFHGPQITDEALKVLLQNRKGWQFQQQSYPAWGYTVLTAYPDFDVVKHEVTILSLPAAGTVLMVGMIFLLQMILLKRMVLSPVHELTCHLTNADLNTLLPEGNQDEIGALALSFNQYVLRLRRTLLKVRDSAAATAGNTDQIRGISESAVARMFAQRLRAEEAAGAAEQLSGDIAGISRHTADASQKARAAADAARNGSELVELSVNLIRDLTRDTQESASRVSELNKSAEEIGSIVVVIREIAAGTNLLALNASIEAARAGEHGRGFAVVAGEVRRLAERTAQATQQVSTLVEGIKNETQQTSLGIQKACERAMHGEETVASLSSTFREIAGMVIGVDGKVEEIAVAAQQEVLAANSVRETMGEVAAVSQDNANGAGQIVEATGKLLETASSLEAMVEQFHLVALKEDLAA